MKQKLVFTDLDGTLLDHHNYSFAPASKALALLKEKNIPLILTTSKTLAEIKELQKELDNEHAPSIAENGSVIFIPANSFENSEEQIVTLGKSRSEIVEAINAFPSYLRKNITGFSDMSTQDICNHTGLPQDKAGLAANRHGSEPFLWSGNEEELDTLKSMLAEQNIRLIKGGRFVHALGQTDKVDGMTYLAQKYKALWSTDNIDTIALGDGPNDKAMLLAAGTGIAIPNKYGVSINFECSAPNIIHAQKQGPAGWNKEIKNWLEN